MRFFYNQGDQVSGLVIGDDGDFLSPKGELRKLLPWEGSWTRQTRFVTSLNYMRLPAKRLDPSDLSRPYRGWSTSLELQGNGPGKMPGPHLGGGEPA